MVVTVEHIRRKLVYRAFCVDADCTAVKHIVSDFKLFNAVLDAVAVKVAQNVLVPLFPAITNQHGYQKGNSPLSTSTGTKPDGAGVKLAASSL